MNDRAKPKPGPNDVVCSGCWKVRSKSTAIGWVFIKFNHLESVLLCPPCKDRYGADFEKMLKAGL